MDDFINNFTNFRDWLHTINPSNYDFPDILLKDIIDKFEKYGLNDVF